MADYLRGCRIKLYPTEEQKALINRAIQIYRAAYNAALNIQKQRYKETGKYTSFYKMENIFSGLRNNDENYSWLKEISMSNIREALADLDIAYRMFFKGIHRFPKYKSKKDYKKGLGSRSDRCKIYGSKIYVSGIGSIEAKSHGIPQGTRMYDTRITFDGYDYWYTCMYKHEMIDMSSVPKTEPVGIDVGIRQFATTSDGEVYQLSDISKLQKRLRRQHKRMSRYYNRYLAESKRTTTKYEDIPKSKNMLKALKKQRKTYDKIRNKRNTDVHSITKQIVSKNPSAIVIEDIKVRELQKDNWFKKRYPYPCFAMFRVQLQYKAEDRGIPVIVADNQYPSTQICSCCGQRHKMSSAKLFICPYCGFRIDRDLNAAINLKALALNAGY